MNHLCRASYNYGGQVAFVFRLPAGQVEFSGLFLTLRSGNVPNEASLATNE